MADSTRRSVKSIGLVTLLVVIAGCGKSCRGDHPYVPYGIGDDSGEQGVNRDVGAMLAKAVDEAGAVQAASQAPPGTSQWTLDGLPLVAPEGNVFQIGLVRDLDGDHFRDAVVVVFNPEGAGSREVLFYRGLVNGGVASPVPMVALASPAREVPCGLWGRLEPVGMTSAFVELGFSCEASPHAAAPPRTFAVLSFTGLPHVHLRARMRDHPGIPRLEVNVDGSDFDRDGIDDVAVHFSLEGGVPPFEPGPRLSATVRWLDRPAGMSRDAAEPEASFQAIATAASASAVKTKEPARVPGTVAQLRNLYSAICLESGDDRVVEVDGEGGGIRCGISRALEEAGFAEVRAYLALGDVLRATRALETTQTHPAARTASRTREGQQWVVTAAPVLTSDWIRTIAAVPSVEPGHSPAWGALAFEDDGSLLIRTTAEVVRVDPKRGDETVAENVSAWPAKVTSPDGALRWIEAYHPCDAPSLIATFAPTADAELKQVALPVVPTKMTCSNPRGDHVMAYPIAWGSKGLEMMVGNELTAVSPDIARAFVATTLLNQAFQNGSPRSPSGKFLVVPTSLGLLVKGTRTNIYRVRGFDDDARPLHNCAVSNDASLIACVRDGKAFVAHWSVSAR